MNYYAFSGIGRRNRQEDAYRIVSNNHEDSIMVVLSDGMGGHPNGDEAANTVVDAVAHYWESHTDIPDDEQKIRDAVVYAANEFEANANGREMGATLAMIITNGNKAIFAHCGDSRIYVSRGIGKQYYHTLDHTRMSEEGYELVDNAFFTGECHKLRPDIRTVEMNAGERLMVCSDGVYNSMERDDLMMILETEDDLHSVGESLHQHCEVRASDNFTAIIIEF